MCYLNNRLVLNARYTPIARSDTKQNEVSRLHTHITHTLTLFQLRDVPSELSLTVERCAILTAG